MTPTQGARATDATSLRESHVRAILGDAANSKQQGFRFVFLDGCSTGKEPAFANAFKIPPKPTPISGFKDASGMWNRRVAAFAGWAVDKPAMESAKKANHLGICSVIGMAKGFAVYRATLKQEWFGNGRDLDDAFARARTAANSQHPEPKIDWGKHLVLTGFTKLKSWQYNHVDLDYLP